MEWFLIQQDQLKVRKKEIIQEPRGRNKESFERRTEGMKQYMKEGTMKVGRKEGKENEGYKTAKQENERMKMILVLWLILNVKSESSK